MVPTNLSRKSSAATNAEVKPLTILEVVADFLLRSALPSITVSFFYLCLIFRRFDEEKVEYTAYVMMLIFFFLFLASLGMIFRKSLEVTKIQVFVALMIHAISVFLFYVLYLEIVNLIS